MAVMTKLEAKKYNARLMLRALFWNGAGIAIFAIAGLGAVKQALRSMPADWITAALIGSIRDSVYEG